MKAAAAAASAALNKQWLAAPASSGNISGSGGVNNGNVMTISSGVEVSGRRRGV